MKVPPANIEALAALNALMGRRTSVFLSVPDANLSVVLAAVIALVISMDDQLGRRSPGRDTAFETDGSLAVSRRVRGELSIRASVRNGR
jgi:hypothetical protein